MDAELKAADEAEAAEIARLEAELKATEEAEAAETARLEAAAAETAKLEAKAKAVAEAEEAAQLKAAAEAEEAAQLKAAAEAEEAAQLKAAAEAEEAAQLKAEADSSIETEQLSSNELTNKFSELPNTRILFLSGSDDLTETSRESLETIAELLSEYPEVPIAIKGHTDSQGDDSKNLSLSQLRANAVRDFLVARGISEFRLSSFGYGEGLPITTNDTAEGRAANRRIEFSFL